MWLFVIKKELKISGKREFLNLYRKIAADWVYISGTRSMEYVLQKGLHEFLRGMFAIKRIANFCIL